MNKYLQEEYYNYQGFGQENYAKNVLINLKRLKEEEWEHMMKQVLREAVDFGVKYGKLEATEYLTNKIGNNFMEIIFDGRIPDGI